MPSSSGVSAIPSNTSGTTGTAAATTPTAGSVASNNLGSAATPGAAFSASGVTPSSSPSSTLSSTAAGTSGTTPTNNTTAATDALDPVAQVLHDASAVASGNPSSESGYGNGNTGSSPVRGLAGLNLDNPVLADGLNAGPDSARGLFDVSDTSELSGTVVGSSGKPRAASLFQMNTGPYLKFMKQYGPALLTTGLSPSQAGSHAPASSN